MSMLCSVTAKEKKITPFDFSSLWTSILYQYKRGVAAQTNKRKDESCRQAGEYNRDAEGNQTRLKKMGRAQRIRE